MASGHSGKHDCPRATPEGSATTTQQGWERLYTISPRVGTR